MRHPKYGIILSTPAKTPKKIACSIPKANKTAELTMASINITLPAPDI